MSAPVMHSGASGAAATAAAAALITLSDACKSYGESSRRIQVLKDLSLTIAHGEFVAIMGPSGSGKSTLMNILGCLDTLDGGSYELGGRAIDHCTNDELAAVRNSQFGFVFQLFNLIPRLTAQRNVELPMVYAGVRPAERRQRALAALASVGLQDRCEHSPAQLSGGQQQRVAIARALVNEPRVIIADEPTGSLDSQSGEEIMQIFGRLNAAGKTIIMVTHENDIAERARRIVRLRDGRIERDEVRA